MGQSRQQPVFLVTQDEDGPNRLSLTAFIGELDREI
jgi:hypothetical protein